MIHPPARIDKKIKQKVLIMIHYLVIGVRRDPGQDPMDYDSFAPARLNFSSEKQLTTEELKEAFKQILRRVGQFAMKSLKKVSLIYLKRVIKMLIIFLEVLVLSQTLKFSVLIL